MLLLCRSRTHFGQVANGTDAAEAVGAEEAGDDEQVEDDPAPGLSSREVFNLLRSQYSNSANFATELLREPHLQRQLRVIVAASGPLHEEYKEMLEHHKTGQWGMLMMAAERSAGSWTKAMAGTLALLNDESLRKELGILPPSPRFPLPLDDPTAREDVAICQNLFDLVTNLAANRAWSQMFYSMVFPWCLAAAYVQGETRKQSISRNLSDLANALLSLEEFCMQPTASDSAKALLYDIGTHNWAVTREVLVEGERCGWSLDDAELKALCVALFAAPHTTKEILESAFGWLRDTLRHNKNQKLSTWARFLYLLSNPYGNHDGGVTNILPSKADFQPLLLAGFNDKEITNLNLWSPQKTALGEDFPRPAQILGIRPAGFHANRVSASAMATALTFQRHGFRGLELLWTGCSSFKFEPNLGFWIGWGSVGNDWFVATNCV